MENEVSASKKQEEEKSKDIARLNLEISDQKKRLIDLINDNATKDYEMQITNRYLEECSTMLTSITSLVATTQSSMEVLQQNVMDQKLQGARQEEALQVCRSLLCCVADRLPVFLACANPPSEQGRGDLEIYHVQRSTLCSTLFPSGGNLKLECPTRSTQTELQPAERAAQLCAASPAGEDFSPLFLRREACCD